MHDPIPSQNDFSFNSTDKDIKQSLLTKGFTIDNDVSSIQLRRDLKNYFTTKKIFHITNNYFDSDLFIQKYIDQGKIKLRNNFMVIDTLSDASSLYKFEYNNQQFYFIGETHFPVKKPQIANHFLVGKVINDFILNTKGIVDIFLENCIPTENKYEHITDKGLKMSNLFSYNFYMAF